MSYNACCFIGILASEVLRTERCVMEITKYNSDTGHPYTKEVVEEVRFLGTMEVSNKSLDDLLKQAKSPIKVVGGLDDEWLGIPFHHCVDEYKGISTTSPDHVEKTIHEAKVEFAKLGYTGDLVCILMMRYT